MCSIIFNSKSLFENSQKILSYNDTKTDTNLKISRYANIANINNKNYLIEFTTKDKNGEILLYSIKNTNNKTVSAKRLHEINSSAPDTANYTISNIQRIFKSKLVQKYNNDYKNSHILFQSAKNNEAQNNKKETATNKSWAF